MRGFSQLLDALVYTRSRNAKLKLVGNYLHATPDPDRGWAMAALTGDLDIPAVKAAAIKAITEERVDPILFAMSRDFVGDLAETVALLWPKRIDQPPEIDDGTLGLASVIERLRSLGRVDPREAAALRDLDAALADLATDAGAGAGADAESIQTLVFETGKAHGFDPLRDWFRALYETLLGASQGPRMGSFIALYGLDGSRRLIAEALARAQGR